MQQLSRNEDWVRRYGWAKLTEDTVRAIRAVPQYHGVNTHLAKRYGVSVTTIYEVRHGYTWKHVT